MSRSFRDRPDSGDDSQEKHASGYLASEEEASPVRVPKLNSLDRYGNDGQLEVAPVPVDMGKRLVAGLIDVLIGYLLELTVNCIPFINMIVHDQLPMVGFLVIRDALFNGGGVGKNLMGLKVVDIKTGRPASFMQSIKRNIVVFGPYLALYIVNLACRGVPVLLKVAPNELLSSLIPSVVTWIASIYTIIFIPYETWRVYSRPDGLRWGDQFAGTATVPADMDFSNLLPGK